MRIKPIASTCGCLQLVFSCVFALSVRFEISAVSKKASQVSALAKYKMIRKIFLNYSHSESFVFIKRGSSNEQESITVLNGNSKLNDNSQGQF